MRQAAFAGGDVISFAGVDNGAPRAFGAEQGEDGGGGRGIAEVAEEAGQLKGYLNLVVAAVPDVGWVADLGVDRRYRRNGVGTVLLASAAHWARENHLTRLILETASKNYPAICFALKNGLVFCGYNDRYYPQQDVALFFGMTLK